MKVSEGRIGRVFVIRLEDGDVVPECIERFAQEKEITVGQIVLVGGIGGVPEGGGGGVEDDSDVVWAFLVQDLVEKGHEPVDGAGVLPLRIDQGSLDECEIAPVGDGHPIDEEQRFSV